MLKVWKSLLILVVSRHLTGTCRPEIMRRIGLASAVMSSLRSVWNNRQLCVDTKVHVYHALVQSVLLYGDAASFGHQETWSDLRCQRQLLHVSWRDHITNEAICKQTKLTSLTELISRRRTSLFGHRSTWRSCPSMHIKPCVSKQTFPQEGIRVQAGRDCQVVPGKHGPIRFQMILECHRALTGMPPLVMAMKEGRYGFWRLRADDDDTHTHRDEVIAISAPPYYVVDVDNDKTQEPAPIDTAKLYHFYIN